MEDKITLKDYIKRYRIEITNIIVISIMVISVLICVKEIVNYYENTKTPNAKVVETTKNNRLQITYKDINYSIIIDKKYNVEYLVVCKQYGVAVCPIQKQKGQ
jgi:hypothetical protein